ncbi:hypothetical protein ERKG_04911 [Escherichia coli H252]|nr:hypothetical protein ERKG_04911 [Escherichia coli H252]
MVWRNARCRFAFLNDFFFDLLVVHNLTLKKARESGELEAMSYAFRGCTGLQHEAIAMAPCCKKGGDSPSRETITAKPLELLASRSLGVILAWHAGFEPATNRLEGGCSVQLS